MGKLKCPFWAILAILAIVCVIAAVWVYRNHSYVKSEGNPSLSTEFADMQSKHIVAAKNHGFQGAPLKDREGVLQQTGLERVRSCRYVKVAGMSHSLPYLTPSAKKELISICSDFNKECRAKSLPQARLIVTSMLRTITDVQELRDHNPNAVENSAHLYGTTFDISWAYYQSLSRQATGSDYLSVLIDVLNDHRKKGLIYARYEATQKCFHITVDR